jgi:hypothetical protein
MNAGGVYGAYGPTQVVDHKARSRSR